MTIFDFMTSQELTAYWEELVRDEAPYPCEELFPNQKKRGLSLKWLKGARGLPIVLKSSAFDAAAIPRGRIGFSTMQTEMPYFKESMYIDEEMRQELNEALETGNQVYIDAIMNRIFDDEVNLLRAARASRERMRMMALTTGIVAVVSNGQSYTYDYQIPNNHKANATVSWSDHEHSDPIEDIRAMIEIIEDETGETCTRAMTSRAVWRDIRANEKIAKEIYAVKPIVGTITDAMLTSYISETLGITILVNEKRYKDEQEQTQKFMPDNTFVLFPSGTLGNTWFGTTPAESDLMTGTAANVSITDVGVAVVTAKKVDPVNVETIVSMICMPSFENANYVGIISTVAV